VSKQRRAEWAAGTEAYLRQRPAGPLAGTLLLIDASIPPRDMDLAAAVWLAERGLAHALVFTKADKRGSAQVAATILAWRGQLRGAGLLVPPHFATSASTGYGREGVLRYCALLRKQWQAGRPEAVGAQAGGGLRVPRPAA
jgi:GTP-binding protein